MTRSLTDDPPHHLSAWTHLAVLLALALAALLNLAGTARATPASSAVVTSLQQLHKHDESLAAQLVTLNKQRRQLRSARPAPVTESWRDAMDAVREAIADVEQQVLANHEKLEALQAQLESWPAPDADLKTMSASLLNGQDISAAWSDWIKRSVLAGQRDPDALVDRLLGPSTLSGIKPVLQRSRKAKHLDAVIKAQRAEHRRARKQAALVATLPPADPLPSPFQPQSFEQAQAAVMAMTQPPQSFVVYGQPLAGLTGVSGLRDYVDASDMQLESMGDKAEGIASQLASERLQEQLYLQRIAGTTAPVHEIATSLIANMKP